MGFPAGARGKEPACQCRRHKRCGFDPWAGKMTWRRAWQLTLVFLSGESHGQRSPADYSSWGRKESDTTERLSMHSPQSTRRTTYVLCGYQGPKALLLPRSGSKCYLCCVLALRPWLNYSASLGPFPLSNGDEGSSHLPGLSLYLAWVRDSEHLSCFSAVKGDF